MRDRGEQVQTLFHAGIARTICGRRRPFHSRGPCCRLAIGAIRRLTSLWKAWSLPAAACWRVQTGKVTQATIANCIFHNHRHNGVSVRQCHDVRIANCIAFANLRACPSPRRRMWWWNRTKSSPITWMGSWWPAMFRAATPSRRHAIVTVRAQLRPSPSAARPPRQFSDLPWSARHSV